MGRNQLARVFKRAIDSSLVCLGLSMAACASLAQDRAADESQGLIENLMRRSAEERWQNVKRRYPNEAAGSRVSEVGKTMADKSHASSDDFVPPSPGESPLIPRLSSLPQGNPDDWVIPARPLNVDGVSQPLQDSADSEIAVPSEARSARTFPQVSKRVAARDLEIAQLPEDKTRTEQSLIRKMVEIVPFYDRDRDDDIRDFAVEKAKDYGIDIARPRPYSDRMFPQVVMNWQPTDLYYHPLYFSDPALERYGHTYHPLIQPFASIARFGTQFCFLPYQMTIDPPCVEVSPLGWYRPGDCAPKLHYPIPLNAEAAAVQAGYVAGLYFLIP